MFLQSTDDGLLTRPRDLSVLHLENIVFYLVIMKLVGSSLPFNMYQGEMFDARSGKGQV